RRVLRSVAGQSSGIRPRVRSQIQSRSSGSVGKNYDGGNRLFVVALLTRWQSIMTGNREQRGLCAAPSPIFPAAISAAAAPRRSAPDPGWLDASTLFVARVPRPTAAPRLSVPRVLRRSFVPKSSDLQFPDRDAAHGRSTV